MSLDLKGPAGLSEPVTGKEQLVDYFRSAEKPRSEWDRAAPSRPAAREPEARSEVAGDGVPAVRFARPRAVDAERPLRGDAQVARSAGTPRARHDAHDRDGPGEPRLERRAGSRGEGAPRDFRLPHRHRA